MQDKDAKKLSADAKEAKKKKKDDYAALTGVEFVERIATPFDSRSPVPVDRSLIFSEVNDERERQDAKWGGPEHDDENTVNDWCEYIVTHSRMGRKGGSWFRTKMVHVAALAIAAIESFDRKNKP
jgi:hypothetical protein